MTEGLFEQVKQKLNITWEDEDTDKRITEIIESAIPDLIHTLGIADLGFDFSQYGPENTLLKAYCLYEYNHCLNEFEDNYATMIAKVRAKHEVEYYLGNEANADE